MDTNQDDGLGFVPSPQDDGLGFVPSGGGTATAQDDGLGFVPETDNPRKLGFSLIGGGAQGIASMGKGLSVFSDPGPMPNNFRTHEQTMLRAGQDYTSPEEAFGSLSAEHEAQRQRLMAPGKAFEQAVAPYAQGAKAIAEETPGNKKLAKAADVVGNMLPLLGVAAIPVVGPEAAGGLGGLQATGDTFDQAFQAYKQQGLGDEEARKRAQDDAIKTGITSGTIYTMLPGAGKASAERLLAKQLASASPTIQAAVRTLAQGADGSMVMGANSLLTSAQAMQTYNPNMTWGDALNDAAKSAAIGFIASAAPHAVIEGAKLTGGRPDVAEQPAQKPLATVNDAIGAKLDEIKALLQQQQPTEGTANEQIQPTQEQAGQEAGSNVPGGAGGVHRPIEIRGEGNGSEIGGGEEQINERKPTEVNPAAEAALLQRAEPDESARIGQLRAPDEGATPEAGANAIEANPAQPVEPTSEPVQTGEAAEAEKPVGEQPSTVVDQPVNKPETLSEGPGAASPGDVPGGSQLEQLTGILRGQSISPKQSALERMRLNEKVADKWAATKDAATKTLAKVRANSQAMLDWYKSGPKIDDFRRSIGEWQAADQKSSLEARRFAQQIQKSVPDPVRREAMTNWIQADGSDVILRARADASKGRLKRGYETALTLNPAEKTLARNIQQYLESRLNEGIQADIIKNGIENYVNQIWKRPNPVTRSLVADLGLPKLKPNFRFAKKRVFDSFFEGEQSGFEPATKDIGHLISVYDQAFNRTLSARGLVKRLNESTTPDGEQVTMVNGSGTPVPKDSQPTEAFLIRPHQTPKGAFTENGRPYVVVDHPALRDWKWVNAAADGTPIFLQGDLLVHPDYAPTLKNILEPSMLRGSPGNQRLYQKVGSTVLNAQAFAKSSKMAFAVFHQGQEAIHAVFHRTSPFSPTKIDLNDPTQYRLVTHGLQVADYNAMRDYMEGVGSHGGILKVVPGLGGLLQRYGDYVFKDYIPGLKMAMAQHALKRNMDAYGSKLSEEQIYDLTASQANAAFGEQNYKMMRTFGQMGRDPTIQDFARLALLAPDFLESRARFIGQALKPYGREQRIALALMAGTLWTGARVLNTLLDDDPHWDKPFSVVVNKREYSIRTVLGDVQHLLTDPRSFLFGRLSAIGRTGAELVTGRDDRGIRRSSMEQFGDALKWLVPMGLDKRDDTTVKQQVLASVGVGSRPMTAVVQIRKQALDFRKSSTDTKVLARLERDERESHVESDYRPLRVALQMGDMKKAKGAYDRMLANGHTEQDIVRNMQRQTPFTGSTQLEQSFQDSLSPKDKKTYEEARREQSAVTDKFFDLIK